MERYHDPEVKKWLPRSIASLAQPAGVFHWQLKRTRFRLHLVPEQEMRYLSRKGQCIDLGVGASKVVFPHSFPVNDLPMTELDLLIDLHKDQLRQGPGSEAQTLKALDLLGIDRTRELAMADIGCGTGAQTLTLAQQLRGTITAVDLVPAFLKTLRTRADELDLGEKLTTLKASMEGLTFEEGSFDLLWSEGAIYIMGFERGIQAWTPFLKSGGYLAVSELSWITDARPKALEDYWLAQYSEIDTISNKIKVLEQQGYTPLAHFVLPESCWMENYYQPLLDKFDAFLDKHQKAESAKALVDLEREEIAIYQQYKDYYSYGFYLARKR